MIRNTRYFQRRCREFWNRLKGSCLRLEMACIYTLHEVDLQIPAKLEPRSAHVKAG